MPTPDDTARDALVAIGIGPAAQQLYVDALKPTAREIGSNLLIVAKLLSVAMSPLQGMVWGLEKVRDWLAAALLKRLADKDPEQIQTPPPYVAGQILLQLPFCAEQQELRDMYANLLASSMQKNITVHPAFVTVISQLTPDEALVLRYIEAREGTFHLEEQRTGDGRLGVRGDISASFHDHCTKANVSSAERSNMYLDNLLRLKVFEEVQHALGPTPSHLKLFDQGQTTRRVVRLSAFGSEFLTTCVAVQTGA